MAVPKGDSLFFGSLALLYYNFNMFNPFIKTRQPFASKFLEAAIVSGKTAGVYMLTGSNTMDMYALAIETARVLNCKNGAGNCICNNCGWVRQNRHPAVITVSPIDYVHPNKDGKAKTVVTVEQARELRQVLAVSSQYHRVVIITDAKEGKEYEATSELLWKDYKDIIAPPVLQDSDKERTNWIPQPLTYKTFHSEPANTLLKTLEEPPAGVTFFFLSRDREDMLDTIVSRAQVISLAYNPEPAKDVSILRRFLDNLPPKSRDAALLYSEKLLEISKENAVPVEELLNMIQEYLLTMIKQNLSNERFCKSCTNRLKAVKKAQDELRSYVNPQAALDSMCFDLVELAREIA